MPPTFLLTPPTCKETSTQSWACWYRQKDSWLKLHHLVGAQPLPSSPGPCEPRPPPCRPTRDPLPYKQGFARVCKREGIQKPREPREQPREPREQPCPLYPPIAWVEHSTVDCSAQNLDLFSDLGRFTHPGLPDSLQTRIRALDGVTWTTRSGQSESLSDP